MYIESNNKSKSVGNNRSLVHRNSMNPLITPEAVKPSRPNFVVEGVFNCGAIKYGDEYILLCRVAESVKSEHEDTISFPIVVEKNGVNDFEIVVLEKNKYPEYNFSDTRVITRGRDGYSDVVYLTSLSHLRIARSSDGMHFKIDEKPTIMPYGENEVWGIEDPRITEIDGLYYISYTAVSPNGAGTALIATRDFKTFERLGLIFLPENKDVTIFPKKIGGKFIAFNRPVPKAIGSPDIWISESYDLIHWGNHKHFFGVTESGWEAGRVGGGSPPILTDRGWIKIYHAADRNNRYCLGAFLLDRDDPTKIIAKSREPLMEPEEVYELEGFFGNVIFTCGAILEESVIRIYYGASDDKICRADITLEDLYYHLGLV